MPRKANHPLKTFVLLLAVAGLAYAAWDLIHVRGVLRATHATPDLDAVVERVYLGVEEAYGNDPCFVNLIGVVYRANEDRYRVQVRIAYACMTEARTFCRDLAAFVHGLVDEDVSVFAFTESGSPIGQYVE